MTGEYCESREFRAARLGAIDKRCCATLETSEVDLEWVREFGTLSEVSELTGEAAIEGSIAGGGTRIARPEGLLTCCLRPPKPWRISLLEELAELRAVGKDVVSSNGLEEVVGAKDDSKAY